jgi:bis(5'-nucleosyl)-tetraphosphatase (symmetrical)
MAVYAIGDVQGCHQALLALLAQIRFDRTCDRLWFTGDLVNRGPDSLGVLRLVRDLGDSAVCVLGNHDLHLLAVASGTARLRQHDTLDTILEAPDRDDLLRWLRTRPLLHHDPGLGYTMIHAGLLPAWDLTEAQRLAREAEAALQADDRGECFMHLYGDLPDRWSEGLQGYDRLRVIINAFTRLRYCDLDGAMDLRFKGAPGTQPTDLLPWFRIPWRRSRDLRIVFGHWSTLGRWQGEAVVCLDSGCVWGGALTALQLDAPAARFTSVACARQLDPCGS